PYLATTSHFNLTFEGLVEISVSLCAGVLDPKKHSAVTFKEILTGGRNLDKTIRDWGIRFKLKGSNHIPLSDTMNSIIKLISAQLEAKSGKAVMIIAGNLHKESTSQER
ncbi:hypothetical protein Godav_015096, partial [Gossypium davidsonii]|nr:hypothetical protein [Gossypium davidsonii]MBA0650074.1 hypothetical protein [Gossypium klotzschianum]